MTPPRLPFRLSRRRLVQGSLTALTPGSMLSEFDLWSAEVGRVLKQLDHTPEAEEARRNGLLDRWEQLELLILNTPGSGASAARAKADLLWRLLEMERHENTAAMRDVRDFVFRWS